MDGSALKITKDGIIVGYVSRKFAKMFTYILMSGGRIGSKVTRPPQNKRNNGVEVPCFYRIKQCIDNADDIIKEITRK